ncbi:MAG TPA: 4Fe-4S binding protein, partial [candidate division Zixibacteria bacterium]|nr:4Fe-4S binding protein [candidate division Zixibacteria bacterium]
YAAVIAERLQDDRRVARTRFVLWSVFSGAVFLQLALGLAGFERFLMSGALHLPVPAIIAAGPIYRGGGYFMFALFLATVAVAGPAWCSHFCYIGAWDNAFARRRPKAEVAPARRRRSFSRIRMMPAPPTQSTWFIPWCRTTPPINCICKLICMGSRTPTPYSV